MARMAVAATLAIGLLATPLCIEAQHAAKIYRIGVLTMAPLPFPACFVEQLRRVGIFGDTFLKGAKPAVAPAAGGSGDRVVPSRPQNT
jgi:hypothetical protein